MDLTRWMDKKMLELCGYQVLKKITTMSYRHFSHKTLKYLFALRNYFSKSGFPKWVTQIQLLITVKQVNFAATFFCELPIGHISAANELQLRHKAYFV